MSGVTFGVLGALSGSGVIFQGPGDLSGSGVTFFGVRGDLSVSVVTFQVPTRPFGVQGNLWVYMVTFQCLW